MKLVKAGADTRVLNANGHTPLIAAVLQRDLTIVQLLIDGGADVDGKDSEEWTPLMWCQDEDILRLLVESGANVNAQNDRGETPLMFASTPESAAILIEAGADIHIKDDRGYSAFERFRSSQNPYASDIMVILKNAEKAQ